MELERTDKKPIQKRRMQLRLPRRLDRWEMALVVGLAFPGGLLIGFLHLPFVYAGYLVFFILALLWARLLPRVVMYRQAQIAIDKGQLTRAISVSNRLTKRYPKDANAFVTAAAAYVTDEDPATALKLCDHALSLDPTNFFAYNNRGVAHLKMNEFDDAMADLNKSMELCKNRAFQPFLYCVRAAIHAHLRDGQSCVLDCERALSINPKMDYAFVNRAFGHILCGNLDKARADLETVSTRKLNLWLKAAMYTIWTVLEYKCGSLEKAFDKATAAIETSANYGDALAINGFILMKQGNLEYALDYLNMAIKRNHFNAQAYWFRHQLYELMQEHDKAQVDKNTALEFGYRPYLD